MTSQFDGSGRCTSVISVGTMGHETLLTDVPQQQNPVKGISLPTEEASPAADLLLKNLKMSALGNTHY